MSIVGKLIDAASENLKTLLVLGGSYVALVEMGEASYPDLPALPEYTTLAAMGVIGALLAGHFAGGKIWDLLPDPPRVYLVALRAEDTESVEVWELTPDQFEAMEVADGTLNELPEAKYRAYECLTYDPEANVAVANWRESVPSSEIMGKSDVTDALDQISELRTTFEKEARIGGAIRRRIGAIVRALDRERAMDQNAAIEGHVAPSIGQGRSTDEVIQEVLGDLSPDYMTDDDQAKDADQDGEDWLLDIDPDAFETVEPDGGEVVE